MNNLDVLNVVLLPARQKLWLFVDLQIKHKSNLGFFVYKMIHTEVKHCFLHAFLT